MVQVTRFPKFEEAQALVEREKDINTGVRVLLRAIADEILANKGSHTELDALAKELTNASGPFASALLANTKIEARMESAAVVAEREAEANRQQDAQREAEAKRDLEARREVEALQKEREAEEEAARQANETTRQTTARHKAEEKAKE